MENREENKQNNRKEDEIRDPQTKSNSTTKEKEWDPKNDPDENWGTEDDDQEDTEKRKEKDPDEKVKY